MVIDAHQHFWNLERAEYDWLSRPGNEEINRDFEFDDLEPILLRHGISRTVLVQAADSDADTDYLLEVCSRHEQIAGVVAYVALHRPAEAAARLDLLKKLPSVVGVRNLIHDQPDPDWLLRPDVCESLGLLEERRVPFDVVSVLPRHLQHVPTLSERFPQLRMVIDHLSKPPIRAGDDRQWRSLIAAAAANPNVYAKISGLYPAAGALDAWEIEDLRAAFEAAVELFGADRLMFGSDWPVAILAGGYDRVWDALSTLLGDLDISARDAILAGTASSFYGLPPS